MDQHVAREKESLDFFALAILRDDLLLDRNEHLVHNGLQISVSFDFLDEIFGGLLLFCSRGTQNVPFLVSHRQKSNYNA